MSRGGSDLSATNVFPMDTTGTSDPYLVISLLAPTAQAPPAAPAPAGKTAVPAKSAGVEDEDDPLSYLREFVGPGKEGKGWVWEVGKESGARRSGAEMSPAHGLPRSPAACVRERRYL